MMGQNNGGISYRDYVNALLNGNPYAYNIGDVGRYYVDNMRDRIKQWYLNNQMQNMIDDPNRQRVVPNDYNWIQHLGY